MGKVVLSSQSSLDFMIVLVMLFSNQAFSQPSGNVDVAFLMDSSGSIGDINFETQKQFVNRITDSFLITPGRSHAAVIKYSDEAELEISLGTAASNDQFKNDVDNIRYTKGKTRIDRALALANSRVFSASGGTRQEAVKIAIVLTDGKQTQDPDVVTLDQAVRPLHDKGVQVFVVGIGGNINKTELRKMVLSDKDLFLTKSFDDLLKRVREVSSNVAERIVVREGKCPISGSTPLNCPSDPLHGCFVDADCPGSKKCCNEGCIRLCTDIEGEKDASSHKLDIAFLMDSSASISSRVFFKQKDFINYIISQALDLSEEQRVATMRYSDEPRVDNDFGDLGDPFAVEMAVGVLPQLLGTTRIDKALLKSFTRLFGPTGSARPDAVKVVVLMTDGEQTEDPDVVPLRESAELLKDSGVYLLVLGVGHRIDEQALTELTEKRDIFYEESIDSLVSRIRSLIANGNEGQSTIPGKDDESCKSPLDVMFVVDGSLSMGLNTWQNEIEYLKVLSSAFSLSPNGNHLAVIEYASEAEIKIDFSKHDKTEDFLRDVDTFSYISGKTTRIDKALNLAYKSFFIDGTGARRTSKKVLIVMSDGQQVEGAVPIYEASESLNLAGVEVYVLGLGYEVDRQTLKDIARKDQNVYMGRSVRSFSHLLLECRRLAKDSCQSDALKKCQNARVDLGFVVDASHSYTADDFERAKDLIKSISGAFDVDKDRTHTGVVLYNDIASVAIRFKDANTPSEFVSALYDLPYLGFDSRLDRGLTTAYLDLFNPSSGMRTGVDKVLVLIAGKPTLTDDSLSINQMSLLLRRSGTKIFVVGVGEDVTTEELIQITGDKYENLFIVKKAVDLDVVGGGIVRRVCEETKKKKLKQHRRRL